MSWLNSSQGEIGAIVMPSVYPHPNLPPARWKEFIPSPLQGEG